jgi:hypothetical protein
MATTACVKEDDAKGDAGGGTRAGVLLLREDPGAVSSAPEDLRADPVASAGTPAVAAGPVRALEDAAEMPAAHVAGGALPKRMNACRHHVAEADNDNNYERTRVRLSPLVPTH